MFNLFKNLSNKKIILLAVITFVLSALVVVLYALTNILDETAFMIILFILIMIFSTFTSTLMNRWMEKRMDNKRKGKKYNYTELCIDNPYKTIKANFGDLELQLLDKVLYVLIKVNDTETFFSEEQQQVKYGIDKKKFNKLIQFYVFDDKDSTLFRKISILNYQAKNFYVGSFIYSETEKTIYQTDKVLPNEEYQKIYDNFFELINIRK